MKLIGRCIYGLTLFIIAIPAALIVGTLHTIACYWVKPMLQIRALQAFGLALLILAFATLLPASGASVNIAWDPPIPSNNVAGYKIYSGLASRDYSAQVDTGPAETGIVSNLNPALTYYFAITAYNRYTNESEYSSELVWDNTFPVVLGVKPYYSVVGVAGVAVMPSITNELQISDDFSSVTNLLVAQSPAVGTILTDGVTTGVVTVTDEAGNMTAIQTQIICTPNAPRNLRFTDGTLGVTRESRFDERSALVVTD